MGIQTEPRFNPSGGPLPGTGADQSPKNSSNKKIIIGVVIAALVLCCVCGSITGLGSAAYFYLKKTPEVQTNQQATPEIIETAQPEGNSATPEPVYPPTETAVPVSTLTGQGLDVTRDSLLQFINANYDFNFSQPTQVQGLEVVQGESSSQCINTNCAAVTLVGPADNLLVVSEVVPTDPQDNAQSTIAITLLGDIVTQFTGDKSDTPLIIMGELIQAQSEGKNYQNTIQQNGYSFLEDYDAQSHNAGITISRPK
ncbi:MAG TPA: hypothetical protein VKF38_01490 [Anaerolineaceae bacterium]|nr:hypothetical protein [Anaerolineaceae bacterium]